MKRWEWPPLAEAAAERQRQKRRNRDYPLAQSLDQAHGPETVAQTAK